MNPLPASLGFESIPLPGGVVATVRPVAPGDIVAEREFFTGLSDRARFNRFHGTVNGLSDAMACYLVGADQERHVALVATVMEGGKETVVADARYVAEGDCAEFAIAVTDRFQGCGIARRLLGALAACARRAGLRWLVGNVLATNEAMLRLAEGLGFARSRRERGDGVVCVERAVTADATATERTGTLPRALQRIRRWLAPKHADRDLFVPF